MLRRTSFAQTRAASCSIGARRLSRWPHACAPWPAIHPPRFPCSPRLPSMGTSYAQYLMSMASWMHDTPALAADLVFLRRVINAYSPALLRELDALVSPPRAARGGKRALAAAAALERGAPPGSRAKKRALQKK